MQQLIGADVITFYEPYTLLGHGQRISDQYFAAKETVSHTSVMFGQMVT
jgi:hypothetical protein